MNTVEENFEADKIQAAIDYLEFKGELNNIKADAILEVIFDSSGYEFTDDTMIFRQWLQDQAYKLKGIEEYTYIDNRPLLS